MLSTLTRPRHFVKPARVSSPLPVPFAAGIPDPERDQADADLAVSKGIASRRPTVEGRGLTAAEHAVLTAAANDARREVESWAFGLDRAGLVAVVGQAVRAARLDAFRRVLDARHPAPPVKPTRPTPPRGFVDREGVYCPSDAEVRIYYQVLDRDEAAVIDRELDGLYAEQLAYDRMTAGRPDEMLAIGACG